MTPSDEPTFLFILNPAYCGSTALARLLLSSPEVGAVNARAEGQFLPAVKGEMFPDRWSPAKSLDWGAIKSAWLDAFRRAGGGRVMLEKSPPNLMHAKAIERHFADARFVIWMRDPYAWAASIKRRRSPDLGDEAFDDIADDWIVRAEAQLVNLAALRRTLRLNYESFAMDVTAGLERLKEFVPAIGHPDADSWLEVKDYEPAPFFDNNDVQLASLSDDARGRLNRKWRSRTDLLQAFGYNQRFMG